MEKGGTGNICVDVDECAQNQHNCPAGNTTCVNEAPGYKCSAEDDPHDICATGPCSMLETTCVVG